MQLKLYVNITMTERKCKCCEQIKEIDEFYIMGISKKTNNVLDKSSRLLKSEIPSQDKKTYAIEVFEKVTEIPKNILWILIVLGVLFWLIGFKGSMR